ncbi:hypothetical protein ID866_5728 [Astraeus odoratus]|nr:hypothetical protein ID866_5728 [Astraeus odoratus]
MLGLDANPTLPAGPTFPPTLADLSRNASVISSSSDSESILDVPRTPRPRPTRTFSSPRSRSPQSPTLQTIRPPAYLTRELGIADHDSAPPSSRSRPHAVQTRSKSRKRSRSQNPSSNYRPSSQDFTFISTLGEGSYSSVMRARHIRTGQDYAVKILNKSHLIRKDKMAVAMTEKNVLIKLGTGHPGIIRLHWTFQDEWSLFFVLDLASNGEMQTRISRMGSLSLDCARYYTAQIIDALDYMHAKDVIHRDLKPENLLLDGEYHIKITDFGTGKILEPEQTRANSWVGTAQYISPELLERGETSKSSDLWSLGCIVYQMISGRFAFHGLSEYLTWQKIKVLDYTFPEGFDEQAKDFIQRLLTLDPSQRLGAGPDGSSNSREALRAHPFLASIKWESIWSSPAPPLEAGLVKKDDAGKDRLGDEYESDEEERWGNVGAVWDALVGGNGDANNGLTTGRLGRVGRGVSKYIGRGFDYDTDDDGLRWAEDEEGAEFEGFRLRESQLLMRCDEGDEEAELTSMQHIHAEDEKLGNGIADKMEMVQDTAGQGIVTEDSTNIEDVIASMTVTTETMTTLSMPVGTPTQLPIPISTLNEPSSPSSAVDLAPSSPSGSGSGSNSLNGSLVEKRLRELLVDNPVDGRNVLQSNKQVDTKTILPAVEEVLASRTAEMDPEKEEGTSDKIVGLRLADGRVGGERGRDRTLTPVQGNALHMKHVDWLLCMKRRDGFAGYSSSANTLGSGLGVGSSAQGVVVNGKNKTGSVDGAAPSMSFTVKTELGLGVPFEVKGRDQKDAKDKDKESKEREKEKEKEKETRSVIESAERKGEKEFVVLTSTTSQTYAAETGTLSAQWVEKINAALASPRQHSPPDSTMGIPFSLLSEVVPPKPKFTAENVPDMTGKVVLVTGANTGIGKETVRVLLTKNAKVWVACRDVAKGEAALRDLKESTGRDAHLLRLNLANLRSIKESAQEFLSKETQLHVLFNNAGVMQPPVEQLTEDGYDLQFGTNVLGHFYFTKLLLPILLSTAKSSPNGTVRVVNTSSNGHWFSGLDFDTFKDSPKRRGMASMKLYGQSKTGNIVFSAELHRRYRDQGIVSTSLNPGGIKTDLQRHQASFLKWLGNKFLYDVSYGAITQLYAGTAPEAVNIGS